MNPIAWWRRRRWQRGCFHHEPARGEDNPATSWIESQLIDLGQRKLFRCNQCDRIWIF